MAARFGGSRATVYRLFPGKAALFVAVAEAYLPVDDVLEMMEAVGDSPPEEVMPALAEFTAHWLRAMRPAAAPGAARPPAAAGATPR